MFISTSKNSITNFNTIEVKNFKDFKEICLTHNFSPAVFKDGYRNLENFISAECIGLDIDNDGRSPEMTIKEAEQAFKDYRNLIVPSRSHQKEKKGIVKDRFRVILFLTRKITDIEEFYATWFWCKEKWPAIDSQCKDPSRFYFKHSNVHSFTRDGLTVDPVQPKPKEVKDREISVPVPGMKGTIAKSIQEFLKNGTLLPELGRNTTTHRTAKDLQQNGYTIEEAENIILESLERNNIIARDFPESEIMTAIKSAYSTDPKHEPRVKSNAFRLRPISELINEKTEMEWIVADLLSKGGVSLITADPKAGKSTLVRQLIRDILTGGKFLNRTCKQGKVHYYGLEEQIEVVNKSFKRLEITKHPNLLVHVGEPLTESEIFDDFGHIISVTKPMLAVVDTMFDLIEVDNENSYKEVKRALRKVRKLARDSGTHILLVHHNSKPQQGDGRRGNRAILGSQAIAGGVDTVMVLEVVGSDRLISTSGREIDSWYNHQIIFNRSDCTYSLGKKSEEDEF